MQQPKTLTHRPKYRPRPPPRLRTKTGCLTCRIRRKKCSERKPRCHGCENLSVPCNWPEAAPECQAAVRDTFKRSVDLEVLIRGRAPNPALKPILPAILNFPDYKPTLEEDEHVLLIHFSEKFFPRIMHHYAHPGFRTDVLGMLRQLSRIRCMSQLVLALSAQHFANQHPRFNRVSIEYYVSSIANLRSMVDKREIEGSEDWLIFMVMFCCAFERWRPEAISNMSTHLLGAIQVFQLRMKKLGMIQGREASPLERIITEAMLYNAAILSLHVDLDSTMLSEFFANADYIFQTQPYSGASQWANCPILGVGPGLYRAICKLCQLCRRAPLQPDDEKSIDGLAEELRIADVTIDLAIARQCVDDVNQRPTFPVKLFAIAANIMLCKLQNPEIQESHYLIQSKVRQALDIVQSISNSLTQFICWPLYIVGCALVRSDDMVFVRLTLQSIWEATCCGDLIRTVKALDTCWAAQGSDDSGLNMLLQRRSTLYR